MDELTIRVELTEVFEVQSGEKVARMILFTGDSQCDNFTGKILPGGVDTQRSLEDGRLSLSARYILEGKDKAGESCRIFIENNGAAVLGDELITKPTVLTDSQQLKYLETVDLKGTIEPWEKGVIIHISKV